jgi:hypothetical protein
MQYLQLWETGVRELPLLSCKISKGVIEARFGPHHAESDQRDPRPGPCQYWQIEFPCGLKLVLQGPVSDREEHVTIQVHADQPEIDHILQHLDLRESALWRADTDGENWAEVCHCFQADDGWLLKRLDENGNAFTVFDNLSSRAAHCLADMFASRGHKQSYWAENKP